MKPIPISAAKRIAEDYGYDQVVIIARKVGEEPDPCGEHVTTYGVDKQHCSVAARIGTFLKEKIMGWTPVSEGRERAALLAYNDICRSAAEIANRHGTLTNWGAFHKKACRVLNEYHDVYLSVTREDAP